MTQKKSVVRIFGQLIGAVFALIGLSSIPYDLYEGLSAGWRVQVAPIIARSYPFMTRRGFFLWAEVTMVVLGSALFVLARFELPLERMGKLLHFKLPENYLSGGKSSDPDKVN